MQPREREGSPVPLAEFALFRGQVEPELRVVSRRIEEKRYPKGSAIFRQHDPSDSLYALREGLVKLVAPTGKGAGAILHILRPAEIFGELLLSEELTAVALTDVLAAALSRESVLALLSSIPALRLNFIRMLSKRLARVETGFSEFSHTWSYHRLAKLLLRMCEEHGEEVRGGVLIRLRLIHADLANMIGTTRETVTNQLNRFRRVGLVNVRGHHLVVDRAGFPNSSAPKNRKEKAVGPRSTGARDARPLIPGEGGCRLTVCRFPLSRPSTFSGGCPSRNGRRSNGRTPSGDTPGGRRSFRRAIPQIPSTSSRRGT
jgi:CRP/FNR family transcriptional regulator